VEHLWCLRPKPIGLQASISDSPLWGGAPITRASPYMRVMKQKGPKYHPSMPLTPDDFYVNALEAADSEGRMPLSRLTAWEIFPFESDGLRVVPLSKPELPEPSRRGEFGSACDSCATTGRGEIWHDHRWRLITFKEPSGSPLVMMLLPKEHFDLIDLPDELASELGILVAHIARAIESLPHIARAHVSRWGDGGAHLHIFFFARPAGFIQHRARASPSGTTYFHPCQEWSETLTHSTSLGHLQLLMVVRRRSNRTHEEVISLHCRTGPVEMASAFASIRSRKYLTSEARPEKSATRHWRLPQH
jgi:diadenosine tetraphosphate (Ap4A) HIT family hydrolase